MLKMVFTGKRGIQKSLKTSSISVLVNGSSVKKFKSCGLM